MRKIPYLEIVIKALIGGGSAFLLIFAVIRTVFFFYIKRYLTSRIQNLTDAMNDTLRTGEYQEVHSTDETQLGQLTEVFNTMQRVNLHRMRERQAALDEAKEASETAQL